MTVSEGIYPFLDPQPKRKQMEKKDEKLLFLLAVLSWMGLTLAQIQLVSRGDWMMESNSLQSPRVHSKAESVKNGCW